MGKKQKEYLDQLVNNCTIFTDRKGVIKDRGSHPFSSWLEMEYKSESLTIHFRVQCSPASNGSCFVKVKQGKTVVLKAEGSYTTSAFDVFAEIYVPGSWEKEINKFAAKALKKAKR